MKLVKKLLSCQVVELLAIEGAGIITSNSTTQQLNNQRTGGTLIEVMMACVVIMAIALAGGAYVSQSMGTLAVHRGRAMAVAMANSRMEELRSQGFGSLTQMMAGATSFTIVTNNSYAKLETYGAALGLSAWSALQITVQVTNRAPDYASLTTVYSP